MHELDKPLLEYSVHDGWSRLTSEGVEVTGDVPHYIERNVRSQLLGRYDVPCAKT